LNENNSIDAAERKQVFFYVKEKKSLRLFFSYAVIEAVVSEIVNFNRFHSKRNGVNMSG
jgi:hypothetical protein